MRMNVAFVNKSQTIGVLLYDILEDFLSHSIAYLLAFYE
jgi:hypothetical protein